VTSDPEATPEEDVEVSEEPSTAPADSEQESGEQEPSEQEPAEPTAEQQLAERTADLQRLQAEYVNYKRRVDRDREMIRSTAVASVLSSLLPVLDDIGRAEQHGELSGGFKAVADSLLQSVGAHGLERFGTDGDPFDPTVHEALMHGYSGEVDGPTADKILQVGYRIGERIVRPARVSVLEPGEPESEADPELAPGAGIGSEATDPAGQPER